MTREEIIIAARTRAERHQIAEMELYGGDKCNYSYGRIYNSEIVSFEDGVKWRDEHPKCPWISVKDDLPCNHKELIHSNYTDRVLVMSRSGYTEVAFMCVINDSWEWNTLITVLYWMPIPKIPKE